MTVIRDQEKASRALPIFGLGFGLFNEFCSSPLLPLLRLRLLLRRPRLRLLSLIHILTLTLVSTLIGRTEKKACVIVKL